MKYVLLLTVLSQGACDEAARQREITNARVEVLIPSDGLDIHVPGSIANPLTPMYLRDRVTGICFVLFPWAGNGMPTPVSCGVVQGAMVRMQAAGWDPERYPDRIKYFLPMIER